MRLFSHTLILLLFAGLVVRPAIAKELDFGIVHVGQSKDMVAVYHTGSPTGIASIPCQRGFKVDRLTLSGSDAKDFQIVQQDALNGTHYIGGTITITIRFTPTKTSPEYASLDPTCHAVDPACGAAIASCALFGNVGNPRLVLPAKNLPFSAVLTDQFFDETKHKND